MLPIARSRGQQSMLRSLPDFRYEVDRMFDDFLRRGALWQTGGVPAADVYESEDNFVIELDLPGYRKDDIDIGLEQGVLTISGQSSEEEQQRQRTYHMRERMSERFTRSFTLPSSVEPDGVNAQFDDGILRVTLPKAEQSKARRIEVQSSAVGGGSSRASGKGGS